MTHDHGRHVDHWLDAASTAGALMSSRYTVMLEAAGQRLTKPAIVRERIR